MLLSVLLILRASIAMVMNEVHVHPVLSGTRNESFLVIWGWSHSSGQATSPRCCMSEAFPG